MVNKLTKAEIHKLEEEKLEKLKEITWENRSVNENLNIFDLRELPHYEEDWDDFVDSLEKDEQGFETILLFTGTAILSNNPDAPTILFQEKLQELLLAHIDALYNIFWRDEMVENIVKSNEIIDKGRKWQALVNFSLKGNKKH
jgi:hypothetical protein